MNQNKLIAAFSEEHVVRLTSLLMGRFGHGIAPAFPAALRSRGSPRSYIRIYPFQDVFGLRTIAVLMKECKISLQKLREVAEQLAKRGYDHWADVKVYAVKGQVQFGRRSRAAFFFRPYGVKIVASEP